MGRCRFSGRPEGSEHFQPAARPAEVECAGATEGAVARREVLEHAERLRAAHAHPQPHLPRGYVILYARVRCAGEREQRGEKMTVVSVSCGRADAGWAGVVARAVRAVRSAGARRAWLGTRRRVPGGRPCSQKCTLCSSRKISSTSFDHCPRAQRRGPRRCAEPPAELCRDERAERRRSEARGARARGGGAWPTCRRSACTPSTVPRLVFHVA